MMRIFFLIFGFVLSQGACASDDYIGFSHQAIVAELDGRKAIVFFVRNNFSGEINDLGEVHVFDGGVYSVPVEGGEILYGGGLPSGEIKSVFFFTTKAGERNMYVLSVEDGAERGIEGLIYNAQNYSVVVSRGRLIVKDFPGDLQYYDLADCFEGTNKESGEKYSCPFHDAESLKNHIRKLEGEK